VFSRDDKLKNHMKRKHADYSNSTTDQIIMGVNNLFPSNIEFNVNLRSMFAPEKSVDSINT
jgi:hypothetical protein